MRPGVEKLFDDVALCNALSRHILAEFEEQADQAIADDDVDALKDLLPKVVDFARWGVEGVSTLLAEDAALLV
jgi:hypothetical protein